MILEVYLEILQTTAWPPPLPMRAGVLAVGVRIGSTEVSLEGWDEKKSHRGEKALEENECNHFLFGAL